MNSASCQAQALKPEPVGTELPQNPAKRPTFSDTVWKMARAGEAILVQDKAAGASAFIVPRGKYAGVWQYNGRNRMLVYRGIRGYERATYLRRNKERISKEIKLPLPQAAYLFDSRAGWKQHSKHKKILGLAMLASRRCDMPGAWAAADAIVAQLVPKQSGNAQESTTARQEIENGIRYLCMFKPAETAAAAACNENFTADCELLGRMIPLVNSMGVSKRWNFIGRVLSCGVARALRISYRFLQDSSIHELIKMFGRDSPSSVSILHGVMHCRAATRAMRRRGLTLSQVLGRCRLDTPLVQQMGAVCFIEEFKGRYPKCRPPEKDVLMVGRSYEQDQYWLRKYMLVCASVYYSGNKPRAMSWHPCDKIDADEARRRCAAILLSADASALLINSISLTGRRFTMTCKDPAAFSDRPRPSYELNSMYIFT